MADGAAADHGDRAEQPRILGAIRIPAMAHHPAITYENVTRDDIKAITLALHKRKDFLKTVNSANYGTGPPEGRRDKWDEDRMAIGQAINKVHAFSNVAVGGNTADMATTLNNLTTMMDEMKRDMNEKFTALQNSITKISEDVTEIKKDVKTTKDLAYRLADKQAQKDNYDRAEHSLAELWEVVGFDDGTRPSDWLILPAITRGGSLRWSRAGAGGAQGTPLPLLRSSEAVAGLDAMLAQAYYEKYKLDQSQPLTEPAEGHHAQRKAAIGRHITRGAYKA